MYPRIKIDFEKLGHNLNTVGDKVKKAGCSLAVVTKVVSADFEIVKFLAKSEKVDYLADSRIENLASYVDLAHEKGKETLLLRIPMKSEINEVVRVADICQISEVETIEALNEAAEKAGKVQKILLAVDLGDLREGIYFKDRLAIGDAVSKALGFKNIEYYGLTVNLSCYGGILPTEENLSELVEIGRELKLAYGVDSKIVSGGATSTLPLIDEGDLPKGSNNLRVGEAIFVGFSATQNERIPNTFDDAIILEAEVVELKTKPSVPVGIVGRDAFGNVPHFEERGAMRRAIVAIGKQDIPVDKLKPIDERIEIMGGSSDHMILNLTDCEDDYGIGDIVSFKMDYGSLLMATTSKYVAREYLR